MKSKCTLPNVPLALNKDLLITIFTSPDLDKIGLNSILRSPEVLNALPPCARKIWNHPKVVFKYVKTLGQKAFNYVDLGRNISERAKMAILGNPCCCSNDGYSPFVNESLGHIVTTNCSILPFEILKELFMKGTKFRLAPSKESCLLMAINKGISNFVTRVEESLGVQGILSHWKTMILKKASLKLATLSSSRGSSSGISLSSSDLHSLRKFFRNFVISYVDKCSNNFVFTCKKFYLECLLSEVNSSSQTYESCSLPSQEVISLHQNFCSLMVLGVILNYLIFILFGSSIRILLSLDL